MKHATLMYTCMGLMGAAAIIGTIDYAAASKAGKLKNLYKDEVMVSPILEKNIEIEDYSRGAIDFKGSEQTYAATADTAIEPPKLIYKKDKKKVKKVLPPPPPPKKVKKSDIPPPPPPKDKEVDDMQLSDVIKDLPVSSTTETKEVKVGKAEQPIAEKEVTVFERFSRAPLPKVRKTSKHKN